MMHKYILTLLLSLMSVLPAYATSMMGIPVLNTNISKGTIITQDMMTNRTLPQRRLASTVILNADEIVGLEAMRPLRANVPLYSNQLRIAPEVHRGESVTVVYKSGNMVLRLGAEALEDGYIGESIKVTGASNNTITAKVEKPGLLSVQ